MARDEEAPVRTSRIESGSKEHMVLLGLKLDKGAECGYALEDITQYGPGVRQEFLNEILRQRVAELKAKPSDRRENAPTLWVPDMVVSGTVG